MNSVQGKEIWEGCFLGFKKRGVFLKFIFLNFFLDATDDFIFYFDFWCVENFLVDHSTGIFRVVSTTMVVLEHF